MRCGKSSLNAPFVKLVPPQIVVESGVQICFNCSRVALKFSDQLLARTNSFLLYVEKIMVGFSIIQRLGTLDCKLPHAIPVIGVAC